MHTHGGPESPWLFRHPLVLFLDAREPLEHGWRYFIRNLQGFYLCSVQSGNVYNFFYRYTSGLEFAGCFKQSLPGPLLNSLFYSSYNTLLESLLQSLLKYFLFPSFYVCFQHAWYLRKLGCGLRNQCWRTVPQYLV